MNDVTLTMVGNVAAEPSVRQVSSGVAVATFRLASTPRRFDRASGQWVDGETTWMSVSCWRVLADNVATSVRKGDPVIVTGRLVTRSYDNREGERRTVQEIEAVAIGHDLARGSAVFSRAGRGSQPTAAITAGGPDPWTAPLAAEPAAAGRAADESMALGGVGDQPVAPAA